MDASRIVALVILAMIATPIGLGYLLAFDTVERDGWETDSSFNLSDELLNSETPYYIPSTSPQNNASVLNGTVQSAPRYESVTSSPTALPIYSGSEDTLSNVGNWVPYTGISGSITASGNTISAGAVTSDKAMFRASGATFTYGGATYPFLYISKNTGSNGAVLWNLYDAERYPIATDLSSVTISASGSYAFAYNSPEEFNQEIFRSRQFWAAGYPTGIADLISVSLVRSDGTTFYRTLWGAWDIYRTGSNFYLPNGVVVESVTDVYITCFDQMRFSTSAPNGMYADPSEGWRFPSTGSVWTNGQSNGSITLYVDCATLVSSLDLSIVQSYLGTPRETLSIRPLGNAQVVTYAGEEVNLGEYPSLQIIYSIDKIRVTGLKSWPSMYSPAVGYNSVEFDRTEPSEIFGLKADYVDYNETSIYYKFRVDTTEIRGGYFPITKDYTLRPFSLIGDSDAVSIELTSVGVYGDALGINGESYPVTDGKISVSGKDYDLRGLVISYTTTNGVTSLSFNGTEIATDLILNNSGITFSGEWSLTVRAYKMQQITEEVLEWKAGEFGLDWNGAVIVAIVTAFGVFIVLGLSRPFTGKKIVLLLVICGSAIAIFLSLI